MNLAHISFAGAESQLSARRAGRAAVLDRPVVRASAPIGSAEEALDPAVDWILREAGLAPETYRARVLARRLAACRRQIGVPSAACLRPRLERRPELLSAALNSLLIGVTHFFRDAAIFAQLREEVLPQILRQRSAPRVYAPGVSTGQELISVALLLAEAGALERSALLGVDCRPDAIAWARAGLFAEASMAELPPGLREKYFQPQWGGWQLRPKIGARLEWAVADLFRHTAPTPCDLVLFRNVAIYFDPPHAERAWRHLVAQLAPGGWLVTGKAEKPSLALGLERVGPSLYRKAAQ